MSDLFSQEYLLPSPLPTETPFAGLSAELTGAATPLRAAITAAHRLPEPQAVQSLQLQMPAGAAAQTSIAEMARELVTSVRAQRKQGFGIDALMHEFSLSSEEGVALMCLAEALLRIPDAATANRLIADKIGKGNWRGHLGASPSLFVNAAAWGLLITGKLAKPGNEDAWHASLTRMIAKGGEPLIRKGMDLAMRMLGKQFIAGQTIQEALANSRAHEKRGYRYSYDMLGEAALTGQDVANHFAAYATAIHAIGQASQGRGIRQGPGISIKLSALHPRYMRSQRQRVLRELLPRLKKLALLAKRYEIGLTIDAEESERLELSLDLFEELAIDPRLAGFDGLGIAVQAYQKRCPFVIDFLVDLARQSRRKFMVRLVKGAYWDSEIKRAQVEGMSDYPVFTRKAHTDMSYLVCARKLLAAGDMIYPQFATHNAHTLAAVYRWAQELGKEDYEFQCLHGMGEDLYDRVVSTDGLHRPCRIYAPVGSHQTLLAYLVRRLLENGANTSFVNQLMDETIAVETLIADPFETAMALGGTPHPAIPLPRYLFSPARMNSGSLDLNNESILQETCRQLLALNHQDWRAAPSLTSTMEEAAWQPISNPADRREIVGYVKHASVQDMNAALAMAHTHALEWQNLPVAKRAAILMQAADLFEAHWAQFLSLAVREAGKSLPNALAEVREAVDFLRYYATQAGCLPACPTNPALGTVACISPWNFPLAIFTGQIAAALAAGNAVLAKPAEQTPLIAQCAVALLHEAGVPPAVLHLLPGEGESIGAALVADARVKGVIFTGSTEVALSINRTLAYRAIHEGSDIPLIAETGGQNAMIVDSSALTEQVVQDVLASAFDSAGQRCSALRVLCLQEDIAEQTLFMLRGAMQELAIGKPDRLATDIGPVIDESARLSLLAHIKAMQQTARSFFQLALPEEAAHGSFVAPTLLEITSLCELKREVFGPVLHVLRYRREELPELIDAICATGYGLTMGLHTRLDETIGFVSQRAHVGNLYVNRNIIGAVVGVQPFGGEGKSGTGPKAGGPLYLHRLLRESSMPAIQSSLHAAATVKTISSPTVLESDPATSLWREWKAWIHAQQDLRLSLLVAQYEKDSLVNTSLLLPGPTGECNTLYFAPRGMVRCAAQSTQLLLCQLAAVFACRNTAVLDRRTADLLPASFPGAVLGSILIHEQEEEAPVLACVLVEPSLAVHMRPFLAQYSDSIVQVIETKLYEVIPLWRLFVERSICINTSAAGGNANLMSLLES